MHDLSVSAHSLIHQCKDEPSQLAFVLLEITYDRLSDTMLINNTSLAWLLWTLNPKLLA